MSEACLLLPCVDDGSKRCANLQAFDDGAVHACNLRSRKKSDVVVKEPLSAGNRPKGEEEMKFVLPVVKMACDALPPHMRSHPRREKEQSVHAEGSSVNLFHAYWKPSPGLTVGRIIRTIA